MNNWLPFFTSLAVAGPAVALAVLSAQNVTRVSLQFLGFQSIQLPVGIVLAISVGIGLVGAGIARGLWRRQTPKKRRAQPQSPVWDSPAAGEGAKVAADRQHW
ncbi:LapA family protein [Kamptonema formosum]|uniref:LapA family protein n=1 Tax=Kamptonema formosum TaxID=331992 RepID=UPI000345D425|nr:LapA family protein [Oscillatoria sp. PCC 10802]